jgi:N-acylneuraminate cytidylyltransferase
MALLSNDADIIITITPAARNPYFNMVMFDGNYVRLVTPPERTIYRAQDAPPVFDMTTVAYAARRDFVLRAAGIFEGKVGAVVVPHECALDIDTELEFGFAEFILSRTKIQEGYE